MKYPGGEHHGKIRTHTHYHPTSGKVVGTSTTSEERHEPTGPEEPEPHAKPSHYSDASKHPGFKAVQAKIASKEGISKNRAGAILAAASRGASAKAKKANPHLKRVKG